MVCLGNICRSPLAEGILKHKASKANVTIHVDSAGTSGWHVGEPPDSRSIDIAKKYGIDISGQRSRKFLVHDFDVFDKIYAMDVSNYRNLIDMARNKEEKEKVQMILSLSFPNEKRSVPDPYYDNDGFEQVYQMLDEACKLIIDNIKSLKHNKA